MNYFLINISDLVTRKAHHMQKLTVLILLFCCLTFSIKSSDRHLVDIRSYWGKAPEHTLHSSLPKVIAHRIDIHDLDKAELLIALYKRASGKDNLSREKAELAIERGHGDIDYLYGTPMKIFIAGKTMNISLFNKQHGENAVEDVVKALRLEKAK